MAPCPTRVTSVPRRTTRLACRGSARAEVSTSPFIQYFALGSRKITGSGDAIASWIIQYASFGRRGTDHSQARGVGEVRLGALLVVLDCADVSAIGDADDDRKLQRALVAVGLLRELRRDLVERREDESVELDLAHGPEAGHREADRGADDARLGERACRALAVRRTRPEGPR